MTADRPESATSTPRTAAPVHASNGAGNVVRALEMLGCRLVFGIPGGAIMPTYDALLASTTVRHVLVRHEQGAGHAAVGYAQATGEVGVCIATSGPGATNLVTPLADANMDSVPIVAITGQVPRPLMGTDAFQEVDICRVASVVAKHHILVTDPAEVPLRIAEAFHVAATGRPGPVLVDLPKDVQQAAAEFRWPPPLDGRQPVQRPDPDQVRTAAGLIAAAARPVLYVGGGVIKARAASVLRELADLTRIPVVTTLTARGAFPDTHPHHLGMPGMHGSVAAVSAMQHADLLIALGARFDDRVTGQLSTFAPHARVVHVDIDPAEISKNRHADAPVVGDCRDVIEQLVPAVEAQQQNGTRADLAPWWHQIDRWRSTFPLGYEWPPEGTLSPQYVVERIGALVGPDAVYVAGVGQHQMWAAQFIRYERPRSWISSGGLGTMGFAIPAAMGAKFGRPDSAVWAIDGDGCFQMTSQELTTCSIEGAPIKVAVLNNGSLGMVRQWQDLFYEGRYSHTDLGTQKYNLPDFVLMAEAMGCVGLRCDSAQDVDKTIRQAMAVENRPVVAEFVVGKDAQVWPMVAAGTSNDEIMAARGVRPHYADDSDTRTANG